MEHPDIETLDASDLYCPEPIMLLHEKIDALEAGNSVRLICTDPTAQRDVKRFCQFLGHKLVSCEISEQEQQSQWQFVIQKGEGKS